MKTAICLIAAVDLAARLTGVRPIERVPRAVCVDDAMTLPAAKPESVANLAPVHAVDHKDLDHQAVRLRRLPPRRLRLTTAARNFQ